MILYFQHKVYNTNYLGLKNFFVVTVALPSTSELSFTMVCVDFDPAIFCVAFCTNCPVLVIAPLIDCDACLDGVDVVVFVWAYAEVVTDDNVIPKTIIVTKTIGIVTFTIFATMLIWLIPHYMLYVNSTDAFVYIIKYVHVNAH